MTAALEGVSGQRHAPDAIYARKRAGTRCTRGWVGSRAGLDGRKISPHRDSIPDRPARSQSLYRLSYPAHTQWKCNINVLVFCIAWSRNNSVDLVTMRSGFRIPARVKDFSSFQKHPAWLWDPPSLLYNGYRLSFPRV